MNLLNETESMEISEQDSLVLWRALRVYQDQIASGNPLSNKNDSERADWLLAKVIYISLKFGGTLEGRTFKDILEEVQ